MRGTGYRQAAGAPKPVPPPHMIRLNVSHDELTREAKRVIQANRERPRAHPTLA
ncbi:hypothetical protein BGLA2_220003 [Burkholderia gladioli]|nr:hypothetical protein BGLA2_220003 [Burkholderia gladioli]